MKNQHIPFEHLELIRSWINKNISNFMGDKILSEFRKINKIIDYHRSNSLEVSKDLLKRRHEMESKVNALKEDKMVLYELAEKLSSLSKEIKRRIEKPGSVPKGPPKKLSIKLPDGQIICEKKAVDTFIKTLQYIGLDKCAEINDVIQLGYPVVSTIRNEYKDKKPGCIREVDGYFIETKTSTERKAQQLREYAQRLGINFQVDVED